MAQTRPIPGQISKNILRHKEFIAQAVSANADAIFFPELSLTGYEPTLAAQLAMSKEDPRLDEFSELSDTGNITIGIGLPLLQEKGITISMAIFQPATPPFFYSKQFLHADEFPFFMPGTPVGRLTIKNIPLAIAICYEISITEHAAAANRDGAFLYMASVAKSGDGMDKASKTLSSIARQYSMIASISNLLGPNDNFEGAGQSAFWDANGKLIATLGNQSEGMLMYDTLTTEATEIS